MTEPDLIVVGAGSAGCVLARRLTESSPLRVLLIEAGQEPTDPRIADPAAWPALQISAVDGDFSTIPQQRAGGVPHPWPRGKVVGGSSAIHAMGHMRGHPSDFDAWVEQGAVGWGWSDLLPYFIKSETSPFSGEPGYGTDGPLHLMQPDPPHPLTDIHRSAGAALGLSPLRDHNGPERMDGPTLNTLTIQNGCRQSIADAYLTPAVRARETLQIATGATVDRVLLGATGQASGVIIIRNGQRSEISAKVGIVLAAGSIGTPTILMRSGIGPAQVLKDAGIAVRKDVSGVGSNLSDHLLAAGNLYRSCRPVPPSGTQHSESLTYIHASGQETCEAPELVVGCVTAPVVSEALSDTENLPGPGEGYTLLFGITHPRSRGSLWITSPDPRAKPTIDPCYLSDEQDRCYFLEALEWARRIGSAEPYDSWRQMEVLPRETDLADTDSKVSFIERAAWSHHHPIGTCKMGSGPDAVVDPDLKVPTVPNLFICDGSILPSLTTGPVNAAIVAVAERGAERIAESLK